MHEHSANMAIPGMPPGLERPSSWPVRNYRRHAATVSFNAQVLTAMSDILQRVEEFGKRIEACTSLPARMENLAQKVDQLVDLCQGDTSSYPFVENNRLERRVASMELLLFRTDLHGFAAIDSCLKTSLQCVIPAGRDSTDEKIEPDAEASPDQAHTSEDGSESAVYIRKAVCEDRAQAQQQCLESATGDAIPLDGGYISDKTLEFYGITTANASIQTVGEWFPLVAPYAAGVLAGPPTSPSAAEISQYEVDFAPHQQKLDYVKRIVQEADKLLKEGYLLEKMSRLLWTKEELDELIFNG